MSPRISDSISASQIGPCALVKRFSSTMAAKKCANVEPMKKPEKAVSAARPVSRSTITRRSVWSATQPHRLGPKMRSTWISDISTPICATVMPLSA
jgi:hypothetical protein